jgi:hypothetical protein
MSLYFLESKSKMRDLSALVGAIRCSENGIGIPFLHRLFSAFPQKSPQVMSRFFPFEFQSKLRDRNSISSQTFFCFSAKEPTGYVTLFSLRISIQVAGSFVYMERSQDLRVRHRKSNSSSIFSAFCQFFLSHFFVFEFRSKVRDLFRI